MINWNKRIFYFFLFLIKTVLCDYRKLHFDLVEGRRGVITLQNISKQLDVQFLAKTANLTIIESPEHIPFIVDPTTKNIESLQEIDREKMVNCRSSNECQVYLKILINKIFKSIKIDIIDINDSPPTFATGMITLEIPESKVNITKLIPPAVDLDSPKFGVKSYRLENGFGKFHLSANGQEVKLNVIEKLDREQIDNYMLKIIATDGKNEGSMKVNISITDLNDNYPTFEKSEWRKNVAIDTQRYTEIIQLTAKDIDLGRNGQVKYSFSKPSDVFDIDPTNGKITLKSVLNSGQYELTVVATDLGNPSRKGETKVIVIVKAVDNPPQIRVDRMSDSSIKGYAEVLEETSTEQFVAYLTVEDPNEQITGEVTCSLDNKRFSLFKEDSASSSTSKQYRQEYRITTKHKYDRERDETDIVKITCRDAQKQEGYKTIRVIIKDINDNPPIFGRSNYIINVTENNNVEKVLLKVTATDLDKGANSDIEYRIEGDKSNAFRIKKGSGEIRSNYPLDREERDSYSFVVRAFDKGKPRRNGTATVFLKVLDTNDVKPAFLNKTYHFDLLEGEEPLKVIGRVSARDEDLGDYPIYSILEEFSNFDIDSSMGTISSLEKFDREVKDEYRFFVRATSSKNAAQFDTALVIVKIGDKNDNKPILSYPKNGQTFPISSRTPVDYEIFTVTARDNDMGLNSQISYLWGAINSCKYFDIGKISGNLFVKSSLKEIVYRNCTLHVVVRDSGVPSLNSSVYVYVLINSSIPFANSHSQPNQPSEVSVTVIIIVVVASAIVIIILIITITVLIRRNLLCASRREKKNAPKLEITPLDRLDGSKKEVTYLSRECIERNSGSSHTSFDKGDMHFIKTPSDNCHSNDVYLSAHQLAVKERDTDSGRGSYEEGENRNGTLESDSPNSRDYTKCSTEVVLRPVNDNHIPTTRRVTFRDQRSTEMRHPLYSIHEEVVPQRIYGGVSLV
ncbi:DgyrCDS10352 [Dimorphilus gyrociliatus]|uniref:DgyrCDS10352 n=1 Tax=Dimorphilus gyrociliatus TaxID=2664684 RepID=A0A7I8VZZ3_9ANNE|nr:DgyrCDS10352 [Dimorphilus gyrociliatus]